MGHFWKILLLLCVITTTRVTLGNLSRFVQLTSGDSSEQKIEVSGVISTIESLNNTVNAEIRIKTRYPVKVAYCDPHSDIAVGEIVREIDERNTEIRRFIITIPANAAVLNTVLGSAGLRCTVYVNNAVRHFSLTYGTDGGVRLFRNSTNTELRIMKTVYEDAPHLLWLLVTMITVALFIIVTIPVALIIRHRRAAFN